MRVNTVRVLQVWEPPVSAVVTPTRDGDVGVSATMKGGQMVLVGLLRDAAGAGVVVVGLAVVSVLLTCILGGASRVVRLPSAALIAPITVVLLVCAIVGPWSLVGLADVLTATSPELKQTICARAISSAIAIASVGGVASVVTGGVLVVIGGANAWGSPGDTPRWTVLHCVVPGLAAAVGLVAGVGVTTTGVGIALGLGGALATLAALRGSSASDRRSAVHRATALSGAVLVGFGSINLGYHSELVAMFGTVAVSSLEQKERVLLDGLQTASMLPGLLVMAMVAIGLLVAWTMARPTRKQSVSGLVTACGLAVGAACMVVPSNLLENALHVMLSEFDSNGRHIVESTYDITLPRVEHGLTLPLMFEVALDDEHVWVEGVPVVALDDEHLHAYLFDVFDEHVEMVRMISARSSREDLRFGGRFALYADAETQWDVVEAVVDAAVEAGLDRVVVGAVVDSQGVTGVPIALTRHGQIGQLQPDVTWTVQRLVTEAWGQQASVAVRSTRTRPASGSAE